MSKNKVKVDTTEARIVAFTAAVEALNKLDDDDRLNVILAMAAVYGLQITHEH